MSLHERATFGASLLAFALIAAPALATPAVLLDSEAFLSGPSAEYDSLGSLDKGDHVDVIWCGTKGNWCLVEIHGKKGWVPLAALNTRPGGGGSTDDSSGGGSSGGNGKGGTASRDAAKSGGNTMAVETKHSGSGRDSGLGGTPNVGSPGGTVLKQ